MERVQYCIISSSPRRKCMMPPYSLISVMMADMMMSASLMMMDDAKGGTSWVHHQRGQGVEVWNHSTIEKRHNTAWPCLFLSSSYLIVV